MAEQASTPFLHAAEQADDEQHDRAWHRSRYEPAGLAVHGDPSWMWVQLFGGKLGAGEGLSDGAGAGDGTGAGAPHVSFPAKEFVEVYAHEKEHSWYGLLQPHPLAAQVAVRLAWSRQEATSIAAHAAAVVGAVAAVGGAFAAGECVGPEVVTNWHCNEYVTSRLLATRPWHE